MNEPQLKACETEHDFALIVDGVSTLTQDVEDALFNAGCDDATLSMQYGLLYLEFSRAANSLEDAILSAIRDVQSAGIGAIVLRVDECDLVTLAEIARRIGRSRQLVQNHLLRPEESWNAEVVEAINNYLERERQRMRHPELLNEIERSLQKT